MGDGVVQVQDPRTRTVLLHQELDGLVRLRDRLPLVEAQPGMVADNCRGMARAVVFAVRDQEEILPAMPMISPDRDVVVLAGPPVIAAQVPIADVGRKILP
jgi:hypothetical protein